MLAHPIPESVSPSASRVMNGSVKAFLACTCLMAGKRVIAKKAKRQSAPPDITAERRRGVKDKSSSVPGSDGAAHFSPRGARASFKAP
jgi:hypothetical protein